MLIAAARIVKRKRVILCPVAAENCSVADERIVAEPLAKKKNEADRKGSGLKKEKRQHLPLVEGEWDARAESTIYASLHGYTNISSEELFGALKSAIAAPSFGKILTLIATILRCEKTEICLLTSRKVVKNEIEQCHIEFKHLYKSEFSDFLRKEVKASFSVPRKSWKVKHDGSNLAKAAKAMGKYYQYVLDVDSLTVWKNEKALEISEQDRLPFAELPFLARVDLSGLRKKVYILEPKAKPNIHIYDGVGFTLAPEQPVIWTQLPFLLVQLFTPGGKAAYAVYSVLADEFESFAPHAWGGNLTVISSRLASVIRFQNIKAFEIVACDALRPNPEHLQKARSNGFDGYLNSIAKIRKSLPDVEFAPIYGSYCTLYHWHGYRKECNLPEIIKNAYPSALENPYLNKVAAGLGYSQNCCSVIFPLAMLSRWKGDDVQFLQRASKEIAYWMLAKTKEVDNALLFIILEKLLIALFAPAERPAPTDNNSSVNSQKEAVIVDKVVTALQSSHDWNELRLIQMAKKLEQDLGLPIAATIAETSP